MTGELRYAVLKSPPTAKEMIKPCLATAEDLQMSLAELNAAAHHFLWMKAKNWASSPVSAYLQQKEIVVFPLR